MSLLSFGYHCSYGELCKCWSTDPSVRPSASELATFFQQRIGCEDLPHRYLVSVLFCFVSVPVPLQCSYIILLFHKICRMKVMSSWNEFVTQFTFNTTCKVKTLSRVSNTIIDFTVVIASSHTECTVTVTPLYTYLISWVLFH